MLIANYVYEKVGAKRKKVIHYENALPVDRMFGWDEMGHFKVDQYILMHSVIYRTQLIKEFGLKLPEHTFYVDNIFVFEPLPVVQKMYYMNVNFYRYFIGREFLIISGTDENLVKKKELWKYVKDSDSKLYKELRYSILGNTVNLPGKVGRGISKTGYKVMNKLIGFN